MVLIDLGNKKEYNRKWKNDEKKIQMVIRPKILVSTTKFLESSSIIVELFKMIETAQNLFPKERGMILRMEGPRTKASGSKDTPKRAKG